MRRKSKRLKFRKNEILFERSEFCFVSEFPSVDRCIGTALIFVKLFIKKKFESPVLAKDTYLINKKTAISVANAIRKPPRCKGVFLKEYLFRYKSLDPTLHCVPLRMTKHRHVDERSEETSSDL